jgi:Xaa-Pro aminopeptidase
VDIVWGKERPPRPSEPVKVLDIEYTGKKFQEKLEDLRKELEKKKSAGIIICTFTTKAVCSLCLVLTS